MSSSNKIIISAVAVVALGIGVTVAAAQSVGAEEPVFCTASEINSSESSVTEISNFEKPIEVSLPEDDGVSEVEEKKIITPEEWANGLHMPPLANLPEDFDYSGYREHISTEFGSEVYAVDDGVVCYADNNHYNGGFGAVIVIKHTDNAYTLYGHLDMNDDFEVCVGESVKAGQLIAHSGDSGRTHESALLYRFQETEPVFYNHEDDKDYDNIPAAESDEYDYIILVEGGFICRRYN